MTYNTTKWRDYIKSNKKIKKASASKPINEGGAMMHFRDYQMQRVLTITEAMHVLEELTRFVKKNAGYNYPRPGYGEALSKLEEVKQHLHDADMDHKQNPPGSVYEEGGE